MANTAGLWRLRLTMATTVALIIAVTTLAFSAVLWWFDALDLMTLFTTVGLFNVAQWLFAPYLVNMMYKVKKAEPGERPELQGMIEQISQRRGISTPKLMISGLQIPNRSSRS